MVWYTLFPDMEEEWSRVSRSLYTTVNDIIHTRVIIDIRRTTTNLRDDILNIENELIKGNYVHCYSGSKAEGLRFNSSDDDWMFIYKNIKVIPADSYMAIYDSNTTLLMMENEMTKPGFTLLRLIGESTNQIVTRSTESTQNGRYVSCKQWRELHTAKHTSFAEPFTHGPCASFTVGSCEYDMAFCLRSDIWPSNARDCIRRLNQSPWPSHDTILSIVNDGVLFVPIGAKQSIFENTEWRMSFSLAEKKLIHAMNHTQFLCYGLLKIFLKEAIDVNPDVKGLLCSYFLKTALFWEITTTKSQWNPLSLLNSFWNCFCRLLQWVSCSYCPNFFIPENNMFQGKIEGANRDNLLRHLKTLYCEGYKCLLRCSSLSDYMSLIMDRPDVALAEIELSKSYIAVCVIAECYLGLQISFPHSSTTTGKTLKTYCLSMDHFASTMNNHKRFLLKIWLHRSLTNSCFNDFNNSSTEGTCNRSYYQNLADRLNILGRCRTDSVGHFLYQAMLCYRSGRYNQALRLVEQSKVKSSDKDSIHMCKLKEKIYKKAGGENLTIQTMLPRHFIYYIIIDHDQQIPELFIERHSSSARFIMRSPSRIPIPPLVCAFFLQYLCQRKLKHLREADEALYELSLLIQHDDGRLMCTHHPDISWQILGICQQMTGDDRAACQSYLNVLKHEDNRRHTAACIRLGTILVKYLWQSLTKAILQVNLVYFKDLDLHVVTFLFALDVVNFSTHTKVDVETINKYIRMWILYICMHMEVQYINVSSISRSCVPVLQILA